MSETPAVYKADNSALMEAVLVGGDLASLTPRQRTEYYLRTCDSLRLNALTKPFEYIELQGPGGVKRLTLYARRDATDQLRSTRQVSVSIVARELVEGVYTVTARATMPDGRTDESIGAVALAKEGGEWKTSPTGKRYFAGNGEWKPLQGEERANAMMKAETKAKRRVTLSICGLGLMDETEAATVPGARVVNVDTATGEIIDAPVEGNTESTPVNGDAKRLYNERAAAMIKAGTLTRDRAIDIVNESAGDYARALDVLDSMPKTEAA